MSQFDPCTVAVTVSQTVTVACGNSGPVYSQIVSVTRSSTSLQNCDEAYVQARGIALAALAAAVTVAQGNLSGHCPQPN